MKLPGGDGAHIDPRKLVGYALKRDHEIGGPKARVFEAIFGRGGVAPDTLRSALLLAARSESATPLGSNGYGDLYRLDFDFHHAGLIVRLRSGWIRPDDGGPTRLTTVFVLSSRG